MRLQRYKSFIKESISDEIGILKELSLDLSDNGLKVSISEEDERFHVPEALYMVITDEDQIFCKKWPEDDMDWLNNKPIIKEFIKRLYEFGFTRDVDYKLYGGGLSITLVFSKKGRKAIKL